MTPHISIKMLSFVSIFTLLSMVLTFPVDAAVKKMSFIKVGVSVVSSCGAVGMVKLKNGTCYRRV